MELRVSAYSVIVDADRLLLSRWADGRRRMWTLPGGGVNMGEPPEEAARREAMEETGLRIDVGELLGVESRVVPASKRVYDDGDDDLHQVRIVYRARAIGGNLRAETNGTTDRVEWFDLGDLPDQRMTLIDYALALARPDRRRNEISGSR